MLKKLITLVAAIALGGCSSLDRVTNQTSELVVIGPSGMLSPESSMRLVLDGPMYIDLEGLPGDVHRAWETSYFSEESDLAVVRRCVPARGVNEITERTSCRSYEFTLDTPGANNAHSSVVVFTDASGPSSRVGGTKGGIDIPLPNYYISDAWEHLQRGTSLQGMIAHEMIDPEVLMNGEVVVVGSATHAPVQNPHKTIVVYDSGTRLEVMPIDDQYSWVTLRPKQHEGGVVNFADPLRKLLGFGGQI